MNTHDDHRDDERFRALLAPLNQQVPPCDETFRRTLRARSLAEFAGAGRDEPAKQHSSRRSLMIRYALRSGAVAVAAGVLVVLGMLAFLSPAAAEPTLGEVLNTLADANTAHLSIQHPDAPAAEAWFRRPGLLRKNNPDGTHLIVRDRRAWLVDDKANRATPQSAALFTGDERRLDVLALLGLGDAKDLAAALAAKPAEKVTRDGAECLVYRTFLDTPQGRIRIDATADAATLLLRSLETQVDRDGKLHPQATLTVLAVNEPAAEELFVLGDALAEDGRIGKVVDAQGLVSVKPVMADRWTPVGIGMIARPGDWVRTDVRGANAATVRLLAPAEIVVGPGSLVELVTPRQLRVHYGEVRVDADPDGPIELLGPDDKGLSVAKRGVYRVKDGVLAALDADPLWLQSYEGQVANESIGSLIANVDGRNVPLTVGYHKVTVDIRDQIARTVVEESFVNHTDARLEGVFYFPLPQDASISGFGMWIGGELIEADVVEKQRAREIYETILREKRDPGLLEWSGGNLFKARVFPIEPHSEKRIKITYTQVLPLKGRGYRYSYALQSDLLRLHPLRELQIDVRVHSAVPLASVTSPTHPARIDQTAHAAHVEFAAQEYTPSQDFEVAVEIDSQAPEVVVVPHRRGDDGYFMLLLTPPEEGDGWRRDVLPAAAPQDLLVLADTSGSMTPRQREIQAEFIAALLGSLGPKDTFNLAVCDVDCQWLFDRPVGVTDDTVSAVRDTLARRVSLGWSDLDRAFASAMGRVGPGTRVIYVGDGIPATADADPVAFANRLKRLHAGKGGTWYAVSVGSTYESGVLAAIASLGGGSVRTVDDPRQVREAVRELLGEIARPPLRDLRVEFAGLRTARVYPDPLPNVAAGSQQILLGRYLPEGQDQQGEVIVSGTQGGAPVRFRTRVSLKDDESGNSFIPRLWARMHLDVLLQQGASQAIQDEVIALSEEYHIITPYTSLLVLESDADRERFGVKRRFLMRDGEKFFADGRDSANYALRQQQMQRAGTWRIGLRRGVLQQLAALGRDATIFQSGPQPYQLYVSGALSGPRLRFNNGQVPYDVRQSGVGGGGKDYNGRLDSLLDLSFKAKASERVEGFFLDDVNVDAYIGTSDDLPDGDRDLGGKAEWADALPQPSLVSELGAGDVYRSAQDAGGPMPSIALAPARKLREKSRLPHGDGLELNCISDRRYDYYTSQYDYWVNTLFPPVPAPTAPAAAVDSGWPREARQISEKLLRRDALAKLPHAAIEQRTAQFDVHTGEASGHSGSLLVLSPKAWVLRSEHPLQQTQVQWCDGQQRAVFQKGFLLGRSRPSVPADLENPPVSLGGYTVQSVERSYPGYRVRIERGDDANVRLVLTQPSNPSFELRVTVDTQRWVVLRVEHVNDGSVTHTTVYDRFVQVGGAWWAARSETRDAQGRRTSESTEKLTALSADDFDRLYRAELALAEKVQFLHDPAGLVVDARAAVAAGKADFDDHFTLLMHAVYRQQWDAAMQRLAAAEAAAGDKPGLAWVRDALLLASRRREELKQRVLDRSAALAAAESATREDLPLSEYLLNQAQQFLEANEFLSLLDVLKPVFERQDASVQAMQRWTEQRINQFNRLGRSDEALELRGQLAREYPRDSSQQVQYAQGLANAGRPDEALAWLGNALESKDWTGYEEESLRSTYAGILLNRGQMEDLLEYSTDWMQRDLPNTQAYLQHLSTLIRLDRIDDANALIALWMQEGRDADPLPPPAAGRLQAAISQALGQGHAMHAQRIEEPWLTPLAKTAIALAVHPTQPHLADRIMGDWRFRSTDAARSVRRESVDLLLTQADTLTPPQLHRLVTWAMANDPAVEADTWRTIGTALAKRWQATEDPQDRHAIGGTLTYIASNKYEPEPYLAFLRLQLAEGPEMYRAAYAQQLFNALTLQPYQAKYEDEAFALLDQLSSDENPAQRLLAAVAALHTLDDRMAQARYDALMKAVPRQEDLTRTELLAKQAENLRLAREGLADRLATEAARREGGLRSWLHAERIYYDVQAGRNLDGAAAQAWEILGTEPAAPEHDDDALALLDAAMRNRMLVTLANLSARRNAPPQRAQRLLEYLDKSIVKHPDDPQWKLLKYELLVALDRPRDLQAALETWTPNDPDHRWSVSLGYLLAEQGKLADAAAIFEAAAHADALGPQELRALADWYMALDQKQRYQRAMIDAYRFTEEWQLRNALQQRAYQWQNTQDAPPPELDEQTLLMFAALFEKSAYPQNHLHVLQQYYAATRDFRLLAGLADAVIGHTAGEIYPFLQSMGSVLGEIRDEATADSVVEHLATVRGRAKTDVDRRALDLLEALVERRGAELLNQPGPHGDKALAALQRAFEHPWSPGEPRLVAEVLGTMGAIAYSPLADEQVRQLKALHRMAPTGSEDRLRIAHALANTQWGYQRQDDAIDLLTAAIGEYQTACDGVLPASVSDVLNTLVNFLEQQRHYARGESVLLEQLKHPAHAQHARWLTIRLYQLYDNALANDGQVSLGSGRELYHAAAKRIAADLDTGHDHHRYQLVEALCSLYRTAGNRKIDGVPDDLRAFAFQRLPEVLRRQVHQYPSIVSTVAHTLRDLAGPRDALRFLVERIEDEPAWFRWNNQDGWASHSYLLAQLRSSLDSPPADPGLEERLLAIVLGELRRDLRTGVQRSRIMYHQNSSYFWATKREDFLRAADEVYEQRKESGAAVLWIAQYLFDGLSARERAVEILQIAYRQERLDENGQWALVQFLHHMERFDASIGMLEHLVQWRPTTMHYRTALMHAYFRTQARQSLLDLLAETDAYFHREHRWGEGPLAALAASTLENQLYEQSVAYYEELIPLHQRTQPNRGIGNGTLSAYYGGLARAYSGLGRTLQAVEAACGAIVSWGRSDHNRTNAVNALLSVIRGAKDLDALVGDLDRQAADTGLHNPVVRKAIGQVYLERRDFARAIAQLQLAADLQPEDMETQRSLIDAYDQQGDAEGAAAQTLRTARTVRREVGLFIALGHRYKALDRPADAERAYTSAVEALPNESESHTALAEVRQEQDRWDDALAHWRRVAELRRLEPTGLLKLAAAQIRLHRWDDAAETVGQLRARDWPARFGDLRTEIRNLEQQIEQGRPGGNRN